MVPRPCPQPLPPHKTHDACVTLTKRLLFASHVISARQGRCSAWRQRRWRRRRGEMVPTLSPQMLELGECQAYTRPTEHRRNRTVHKKLKRICRRLNLQSYSAGWTKFYTPTDLVATREWVCTAFAAHTHTHPTTHFFDSTLPRMDACTWPILGACFPASSRHQSACCLESPHMCHGRAVCVGRALLTARVVWPRFHFFIWNTAVSKGRVWCGCSDPSL
jgi:hypothetical protein